MEKAGLKLYWEIIGVENPERMDPHPSLLLSQFELQLIDAPRLGAPPPPPQSPQPEPSEKAKGKARAEPPRPAARLRLVAHRPEDNYEIPKSTLAPLANYSPASQSNLPASQSNLSTSQSNLPTGQNNLTTSQSSSSSSRSNLPTSQTPAKRPGVAQPVTRPQKSRRYQKTQSGPAPGPKPESLASKAAHNSIRQRLEREKVPQIARDSPSPEPQDTVSGNFIPRLHLPGL